MTDTTPHPAAGTRLTIDIDITRLRAMAEVRSDAVTVARYSVEVLAEDGTLARHSMELRPGAGYAVVDQDGRHCATSDRWDLAAERAIDLATEFAKHCTRTMPIG